MRRHAKALVAVTAMFVLLGASAALALQTHQRLEGEDPNTAAVPGGVACCLSGLAVDQSGGRLYAADQYDPTFAFGRVHRFAPNGAYEASFEVADPEPSLANPQDVAVDNSGTASDGTIYVADSGHNRIDALDESGALLASFGSGGRIDGAEGLPGAEDKTPANGLSNPCGLAVDEENGNLFVADQFNNRIWIFDSSGKYLAKISDSALNGPCGLAFSSSGDLFVRNANDGKVLRFNRQSATEYDFNSVFYAAAEGPAADVAVDTADDHVFVDRGDHIVEYEQSGGQVASFGGEALCCSGALALDSSSGKLYATNGTQIKAFGPLIALPDASTGGVSEVTGEEATLEGNVDAAGGPEAECEFQYFSREEEQTVTVSATGGTFTLSVEPPFNPGFHITTNPLPFDASAEEVELALPNGSMQFNVVGGPGDLAGTHPYAITMFVPPAYSNDFEPLVADSTSLTGGAASAVVSTTRQGGADFSTGESVPCEPAGPFAAAEAVHADLSSLSPATTYHYRLHASGSEGAANGEDRTFTTDGPPLSEFVSVSDVEPESATLHARIAPGGASTSYRFEYVDDADFQASGFANASKAPAPDAAIASTDQQSVSQAIAGLSPATKYDFRITAANPVEARSSAAKSFTTFAPPEALTPGRYPGQGFLPDNRAWEMVSPADKNGGDVIPSASRTRAAADGSAVSFASLQVFGDAIGSGVAAEYIAERSSDPEPGDSGWSTHAITPPGEPVPPGASLLGNVEPRYQGEFSPDLGTGVFFAWSPLTADPNVAEVPNLYLRHDLRSPGHGSYRLLSACPLCAEADPDVPLPPLPAESFRIPSLVPRLAGATPDFSHVIFESRLNLTADAPAQPGGLFGCVPNGPAYPFPCRARLYETDGADVRLAGRIPTPPAIACDDAEGPACEAADFSLAGQGAGAGIIDYLTVHTISDGSDGHIRVFFIRPTNDGTTIEPNGNAGNLYMRLDGRSTVQLNASERTDCAEDPSCGGDGIPDPVSQSFAPAKFLDASADGKRAFFLSSQKLTDDTPGSSFKNLYMYDATKPASDPHNLTFLATEQEGMIGASADGHYAYMLGSRLSLWHDGVLTDIGPHPQGSNLSSYPDPTAGGFIKQSRVTPDGRHLLFISKDGSGLTGYDHNEFQELYLYSAEDDKLQCVSCNPSGAPATASASSALFTATGGSQSSTHQNHPLSEDGRYVFFSTAERLVSRDIDGVSDAYEFDSKTGKVHLLSSGEDKNPSYSLDATADGSDAFFATKEPLSGWDVDKSRDIYDARIGGGFPEPAPAPPACQGDACQPTPTQLNDPTPASSAFAGAGNQRVRKHHHRKHRRRHARKHHQRTANKTGRAGR